ncbi:MAG: hypothetical protein ABSA30_10995 [Candidatus Aminicenantales bacterium]|jgi:hypothetical protein
MPVNERQEPDRDPAVARRTTRPCAIEDGEERTTAWERWAALLARRGRRTKRPKNDPVEPETLPEPPPSVENPEENE